jgi:Fic family protein
MTLKHLNRWIWEQPGWPDFTWDSASVAPATAQRDLAELAALGCLALVGAGRAARYELPA